MEKLIDTEKVFCCDAYMAYVIVKGVFMNRSFLLFFAFLLSFAFSPFVEASGEDFAEEINRGSSSIVSSSSVDLEEEDAEEQGGFLDSVPPSSLKALDELKKEDKPVFCILSIDGGGIRGLIPALYLQWIEEHSEMRICELFDRFCGTSVGGILALGMNCPQSNDELHPKFAAEDFVKLFSEQGTQIFPVKKNYLAICWNYLKKWWNPAFDSAPLEKNLEEKWKK